MSVGVAVPVVTSLSESIVGVLRGGNPLNRVRQRKRNRTGKRQKSVAAVQKVEDSSLKSLQNTPVSLLENYIVTETIKQKYTPGIASENTPTLVFLYPPLILPQNMTSSNRTMSSPSNIMTSPSNGTATHINRQQPCRGMQTTTIPGSESDQVVEGIVSARTAYEANPSVENAIRVASAEREFSKGWLLFLRSSHVEKQVEELKMRAAQQPGNAHVQTLYLTALHSIAAKRDKKSVANLISGRRSAVNPVIAGVYLEAEGMRPLPKDIAWGQYKKGGSEFSNLLRRGITLIFSGMIVSMVYYSVRDYSGGQGGGIQRLLVEDKSFEVLTPDVTFKDVAGNQHVVEEMKELVNFLTEPEKYEEMGCSVPKGYLFCGPPGVGKTLMAKALAGEAGVPFYYASGSAFEEVFVGVGAGRVRKLFEDAQENSPSIIFIDEIDSIGQKRSPADGRYTNRSTLNQILSCMDGFESNSGVIVIAATNDPLSLDDALMREGRFDTKISIRQPSLKGRLEMLEVHTANKTLAPGVDLEYLATACVGMTGAQLANLANTAALRTVLEGREEVTQDDFEYARARLLIGHINKDLEVSADELENTAAHEAGHALLTVSREHITKRPVYITTILPRGSTLGHVLPVPKTDQHSENMAQMIAMIDIAIAGRVGEELHFGFEKDKVTTGCSSDMANATRIAETLIKQCGYSKLVGLVKSNDANDDLTDKLVHDEMKKLFDERYKIVRDELVSRKRDWKRLTDTLVRYKTLTGGEVKAVLDGGTPERLPGEMLPSS